MFHTAKEASFFNLIMTGRDSFSIRMEGATRRIYPFSFQIAPDVQKGYRDYQSLFLVGRNSAGRERDRAEPLGE
jgi:hypothetical protein